MRNEAFERRVRNVAFVLCCAAVVELISRWLE
jgi:hypothetical protein